jgi:predicted lipoprotein with Yx(FWY)xxD motif
MLAGLSVAVVSVAAPKATVTVGVSAFPSLRATILVDGNGRPLYHFVSEKGKTIRCTGSCVKAWPPVILAKGTKATAGAGVSKAKLGLIKRPDGRSQATYAGLPLYRYASDKKGTANGQGLGKAWYVISASGRVISKAPAAPPPTDDGGDAGVGTPDPGTDTGSPPYY